MEPMSPQLQIYNAIFKASLDEGYATFDYLPGNKVEYPFVFIGEQFDQDRKTKQFLYGDVQQTIHVYHTHKSRRGLMAMVSQLKIACRSLKQTTNFYVACKDVTGQILFDNSTSEPLLHAVIEANFTFN